MNLFKLKKDGKVVGYLEIFCPEGTVVYMKDVYDEMSADFWETDCINFDQACSYVTDDKNGDKVFAGDKVKADEWEFEVIWQQYGYGLKGIKHGWWRQFNEFENIELIKDSDNESAI